MILRRTTTTSITVALAACLLAACGDEREATPVALTAHVLLAKEMPRFSRVGRVTRQDVRAFARAHNKTPAELSKTGLTAGVTAQFLWKDHIQAMSIAEEFASDKSAAAEAVRLFRSNSQPEPGATASLVPVTGIPGAKAVTQSLRHSGRSITTLELVFSNGRVTHEIFALGLKKYVSIPDILAAARSLYARINGRPLTEH
jgi:hypothetical protein